MAAITFDDVTRGKPDPEPFLTGAARLGVDPSRCLVVEDAPAGIAAAKAAGCATLAVTTRVIKDTALLAMADALEAGSAEILTVAAQDEFVTPSQNFPIEQV